MLAFQSRKWNIFFLEWYKVVDKEIPPEDSVGTSLSNPRPRRKRALGESDITSASRECGLIRAKTTRGPAHTLEKHTCTVHVDKSTFRQKSARKLCGR